MESLNATEPRAMIERNAIGTRLLTYLYGIVTVDLDANGPHEVV